MALISLVKILLLYSFTNKNNIFVPFIRTIPAILLIYSILGFVKDNKIKKWSFILHSIISIILFSDLVYYEYYGFMPSIKTLLYVGNVPTVWKSIIFILKPVYFIMIIDLIIFGIIFKKNNKYGQLFTIRNKSLLKISVPFMALIMLFHVIYIEGNTIYAYNNYGVFTYHIYDAYKTISNKDKEKYKGDKSQMVSKILENDKKNENKDKRYHGIAEGKNIIVVQFESLQDFLINDYYNGQEVTPNLNKLIKKDSIYFNNFYQQVGPGNTSDAEFVTNNSLYPTDDFSIFKQYNENQFYSFPRVLQDKGYNTMVFHGNNEEFWGRKDIYPRLGINNFISLEDFDYNEEEDIIGLGLNDKSLYNQSINYLKNSKKPFYSMMISLTSHHPYELPEEKIDIELKEKHKDTLFGNYIQSIHYADEALGLFIDRLKEEGLYKDSMIVVYGDHAGLYPVRAENYEVMSDYLGEEYRFDEVMNIPLVFHIPGEGVEGKEEIVGGEIDLFPTMLNLIGIDNNKGKMYGHDLFNSKSGFVANQYYVPIGSFIDDDKVFLMSEDGIFENSKAWDRKTKKPIDIEKCREGYERAIKEIKESRLILENDLVDDILMRQKKEQNN